MKKYLNVGFWFLLFSLILYFFYSSTISFSINKHFIHRNIQNIFNEFYSDINNFTTDDSKIYKQFDGDIIHLKFKKDSLVDWSTNQFPTIAYSNLSQDKFVLILSDDGWYLLVKKGSHVFLKKIFRLYSYENEFLKNGFTWNTDLLNGVFIDKNPSNYEILDANSSAIGYLHFSKSKPTKKQANILLFGFFILFISFLIYSYQIIFLTRHGIKTKMFIVFCCLLIYYFIIGFTSVFSLLKQIDAFQPDSFAYTWIIPSLGHLLLIFISILFFLYLVWLHKPNFTIKNYNSNIINILFLGLSFVFFVFSIPFIVNNTSFNIGFNEFSELNSTSILILISLSLYILIFSLISRISFDKLKQFSITDLLSLPVFMVIVYLLVPNLWSNALAFLLFVLIIILFNTEKLKGNIAFNIMMVLLFSFVLSINLNDLNQSKELNKRKILIQSLALNQDPEVEYLFGVLEKEIYSDTSFMQLLAERWYDVDFINHFLVENYFSHNKHWSRYDFQTTTCDDSTNLILQPSNTQASCNNYFYNNLISKGYITLNRNLYRMEYGSGQINYLAILRFVLRSNVSKTVTIYIEINSKIKRKGFTRLLSASGMDPFEKIRDYSLSRYEHNLLVETYGDFSYNSTLFEDIQLGEMKNYNKGGYNHLVYKATPKSTYILSKPMQTLLQRFAPFANLFIIVLAISLVFVVLFNSNLHFIQIPKTFSFRLQLSLIILITISILIISIISSYFIQKSNYQKDLKNHYKTALSLQTEFEQKLYKTIEKGKSMKDYLYELSIKFASVFNTDINIYDLDGKLLNSTRAQIYDNKLLSVYMNPEALHLLKNEKATYINMNEKIGELEYFSAYMPFHDANGRVVAYLNLPYIAQQDQLSKEVSSFIMTLLNIYMIMMVISVLAILLLSNYITRPLILIKEKMQKIKIGGKNEHIKWTSKDELGDLVSEYNKMLDQISKSTEILANAERENAWQQMAQQVAHEIKNPLTPMKLSLQYLLKALDEKQPNYEERLRNLSSTLIDQIDTLAQIATAFSDFAKMPIGEKEFFNLSFSINAAVDLYTENDQMKVVFLNQDQDFTVFADKNNMIRVFNNLIKNATQSIKFQEKGHIEILVEDDDKFWKVTVSDNGCGISDEEKHKIFLPNFTTKSSGMGLGLVVVRNIILQHGGSIDFDSIQDKGTNFYVWLKKANYE
jgi:two-component system, NtrC family, nitrogen regulation sensor histidine kinase NtrY